MNKKVLFQQGTMQMLAEGLLDGTINLKDLLRQGDIGIGTGEGIDGELIILKGKGYKFDSKGFITELNGDFPICFADVHFENFKHLKEIENTSLEDGLLNIQKTLKIQNLFFAVKLKGDFKIIKTRSAIKSNKPYPTLDQIAQKQFEFIEENTTGTLISYHAPKLYQGVTVAGFHSHFISDDHRIGGHVLDGHIKNANAYIQILPIFKHQLPNENSDYLNADLSNLEKLDAIIKKSE